MEDRAKALRRRIEHYRRCLRAGAQGDLGKIYLLEIGKAELELIELEHREQEKARHLVAPAKRAFNDRSRRRRLRRVIAARLAP